MEIKTVNKKYKIPPEADTYINGVILEYVKKNKIPKNIIISKNKSDEANLDMQIDDIDKKIQKLEKAAKTNLDIYNQLKKANIVKIKNVRKMMSNEF